jgi:uncharacterized protein (DUF2141 family)
MILGMNPTNSAVLLLASLVLTSCASTLPSAGDLERAERRLADLRGSTGARSTLRVRIDGIVRHVGSVRIGLYDESIEFPREGLHLTNRVVPVQGRSEVSIEFEDVPPGRYALAVIHDLDGDERLARGIFGVPAEPVAFSRGARVGMFGPPSFATAAFEVSSAPLTEERVTLDE